MLTCSLYVRREKLAASYQLQKFNSDAKELLDWIQEVKGRMEAGGLPKSLAEAESLIEEHHEIKASMSNSDWTILIMFLESIHSSLSFDA